MTKAEIHSALMTVLPTAPPKNSQQYTGKALRYITFFRYNRQPETVADDHEAGTGHYWQIDLWSLKGDTSVNAMEDDEAKIESVLQPIGFTDFTVQDLLEKETGANHFAIRCYFYEEV